MRTALAAVLAAAALLACHRGGANEPFSTISVDEVDRLVRTHGARVFDANGPETYAAGHVPGAVLVAHGKITDPKVLPADKGEKLVFYCAGPR